MALIAYKYTPCSTTGYIPPKVMMGRKICTTLPALEKNLLQNWPNTAAVKENEAHYFNCCHGAKSLPSLQPGDTLLSKLAHEKLWSSVHRMKRRWDVATITSIQGWFANPQQIVMYYAFRERDVSTSTHLLLVLWFIKITIIIKLGWRVWISEEQNVSRITAWSIVTSRFLIA